jgi:hypothetical protein
MSHLAEILLYVAIAALVVWRVIFRQLRGYRLTARGLALMPAILVLLGGYRTLQALPQASGAEIALLAADLVVLAVLGVVRASTTQVTERDGYAFQQGTKRTLLLWLVTIAVRIGFTVLGEELGAAGALTSASFALTLGVSIGVQNALAYTRAQRLGLPFAPGRSRLAEGTRR